MRAVDALKHAALLVVPLLLVLLAELLVRLSGAAETCPNRHTGTGLWKCDPILHFGVDPAFGSPELAKLGVEINSQGFRGAEFGDKQPGAYRILALGDSCTFGHLQNPHAGFVAQPYPKRLQNLVDRRDGHGVVEVLNAGQPGYNSWHGVMLLRGKLRDLEPDLVTVRFGWNDHLLSALGESQRFREPATALGRSVEDLLLRTALYGAKPRGEHAQ
jgi:hypothetical protein